MLGVVVAGDLTGGASIGIFTIVPENIVLPPLYFDSVVNFGLASSKAETVVPLAAAILDSESPLLTVYDLNAIIFHLTYYMNTDRYYVNVTPNTNEVTLPKPPVDALTSPAQK